MKFNIICIMILIPKVELVKILQNQNKKLCVNCKFFISNNNECSKFGTIDIITGKHDYDKAINIRQDEYKCGDDGIFFEENYIRFIFIPLKFLFNNFLIIFLISVFIMQIYVVLST